MVKVEFYRNMSDPPHRKIYLHRNQIPALNRGPMRELRRIRTVRICGKYIVEIAGWRWRLNVLPDGSIAAN